VRAMTLLATSDPVAVFRKSRRETWLAMSASSWSGRRRGAAPHE
jgi:hypothetical protein